MPNEDNCPLSLEGWIKLYNDEINKVDTMLFQLENHGNVIILTLFLGLAAAAGIIAKGYNSYALLVLGAYEILMFGFWLYWRSRRSRYHDSLKNLISIRENLISIRDAKIPGKLAHYEKIQSEWRAYMKGYYGKNLEISKMNKAEKESKGEDEMDESKFLTVSISLGSVVMIIGSIAIGLAAAPLYTSISPTLAIFAIFMFFSGLLMFITTKDSWVVINRLWENYILWKLAIVILFLAFVLFVIFIILKF